MSTYVYAPFIQVNQPIPPVASLIELHDKNNDFSELAWFTDRDTLTEHLKYNTFSEDELMQLIADKPVGVSHRALVEGATYVDYLCDMLGLNKPSWIQDPDTTMDLRAPMFGMFMKQKTLRKFSERSNGTSSPFVARGVFKEPKDYGVI